MNTTHPDALFLSFQAAVAGRYSIERELGRGGMGVVYLAREVHLDRNVAIKLLPAQSAENAALRAHFIREARLAAKLSHPNIIPIHSVEDTNEFVFYVMSYVDGETLGQRVQQRGPLSNSEAVRVLREVAWALSHAHSHGVVHRDVKPDNIMIESGTGRVLVTDFGIASAVKEASVSTVGGSPEFMSPEQALGKDVDARSDLYALGITGYYALSGRLPFEAESAVALLAKQVTESAPSLTAPGLPVSRKLAQLVERCMAKDAAQRPQSAEAVADFLAAALEQRREVPPALRVFVKRTGRLNRGGVPVLMAFVFGQTVVAATFGLHAALYSYIPAGALVSFAYLVYSARVMVKLGFRYEDVGPAFESHLEHVHEESAFDSRGNKGLETLLKRVSQGALVLGLGGLAFDFMTGAPWARTSVVAGCLIGVPFSTWYLHLVDRRRDLDSELWSAVWRRRIGKAAFAIARKLTGRKVSPSAGTHRATELALGMAAESLYEGLPASTRRAIGDLPSLVRRLETDAQRLRAAYDELQDALASSMHTERSESHAMLVAQRDQIHRKLADAVAALEMIRLNLLRLHAGSGTVESLTINIDMAAEVTAEVERLLEARQEVERTLAFPARMAVTPV